MPAPLALLACVLFVRMLLQQESKDSAGGVTPYLWIPTIWFLLIASRPLALWFGVGGATNEEGSILDQVFLSGLFVIALLVMIKRQFAWSVAFQEQKWLFVLLGFMLLSTGWSDIPFISFKRWFRDDLIAVIICLSVLTEPKPRVASEMILRRVVYICLPFSYVLIHYFPEYGKIYVHRQGVEMWTGVACHKNQLAIMCLVAFLLLSWGIATRKPGDSHRRLNKRSLYLDIAVLLIALAVFMGPDRRIAYSATSLMATMAGLGILGFLVWHKGRGTQPTAALVIAASAFFMAYGTMTPFLGKLSLVDVSSAMGRSSNLTGRGEVWAALIPSVMKQPLFGYGFGGFWTTGARDDYDISDSHNGYLGVILETGLVGLALWVMVLLSSTTGAQRLFRTDYHWATLCLMFSFSSMLHNIGEASLTSLSSRLTAVFLLLNFSCLSRRRTASGTATSRVPSSIQSSEA